MNAKQITDSYYYMATLHYIAIGIILTFTACQAVVHKNEPFVIVGDIDTLKIISKLNIKERASRLDLINEKVDSLSDRVDTLDLTYYFGFCDCQRWIDAKIHQKALGEHADLDELDPRGQVEFNLDKHGYYIEAAANGLTIDGRAEVNGTTIRFIGREYIDKRLPQDGEFTVPDPPKGKVFRYYSYEILRPYQVWGPNKLTGFNKETGDSITETTILTVKKNNR